MSCFVMALEYSHFYNIPLQIHSRRISFLFFPGNNHFSGQKFIVLQTNDFLILSCFLHFQIRKPDLGHVEGIIYSLFHFRKKDRTMGLFPQKFAIFCHQTAILVYLFNLEGFQIRKNRQICPVAGSNGSPVL